MQSGNNYYCYGQNLQEDLLHSGHSNDDADADDDDDDDGNGEGVGVVGEYF